MTRLIIILAAVALLVTVIAAPAVAQTDAIVKLMRYNNVVTRVALGKPAANYTQTKTVKARRSTRIRVPAIDPSCSVKVKLRKTNGATRSWTFWDEGNKRLPSRWCGKATRATVTIVCRW